MKNILLVEDTEKYQEAAKAYLAGSDFQYDIAKDYDEAIHELGRRGYDGIISDCFFPEKTGSGNVERGKSLVEKMAREDPNEINWNKKLNEFGQYINLENPDAKKYAKYVVQNAPSTVKDSMIDSLRNKNDKNEATTSFKEVMAMIWSEYEESKVKKLSLYENLMKSIEKSEYNQPLGVLVAEKAEELGLPIVLNTSSDYHDELVVPVINYAKEKGYDLIQSRVDSDSKGEGKFWEMPFSKLENKLR